MDDLIGLILELIVGGSQTVGETALQFLVEVGVDLLQMCVESASDREIPAPPRPVLRVLVHALLGAGLGWASTWVLPHLLVHGAVLQWLNALASPFLVGLAMAFWGSRRVLKGKPRSAVESFGTAFALALAFGVVRLVCLG